MSEGWSEYVNYLLLIEGCLPDPNLRSYFQVISTYTANMAEGCKLLSIEENLYGIKHRLRLTETPAEWYNQTMNLSLPSSLQHLIISFRSMSNINLVFTSKDSTAKKLALQTLVLPCLSPTDLLDLSQLTVLDIGYINMKYRFDLARLDEILLAHTLRNLTIGLNEWQPARLVALSNTDDHRQTNSEFSSVFENCFDQLNTPDENVENPITSQPPQSTINQYSLQFLDSSQSIIFQYPLNNSWLNKLTNLNLTGVHCHSTDWQHIFNALHLLQSLSLSPCLLFHIDPLECHCQSNSTPFPYQIHQLNRRLLALNLVGHLSNPKESCPIFLEQYKLHSIRHSSIHQHLPTINESVFYYEYLIHYSIQTIFSTLDLHHLSIRIPNYDLHIDELKNIPDSNHLQSLILDVKFPVTFHTKLASLYSKNIFLNLRRLILLSETHFELTPILIDRFRPLECVEILSTQSHLNRATIHYLETVLRPKTYPNLQTFRLWVGTADARHLLKHAQKIIRTAFEPIKPAFQFEISLIHATNSSILYDHTHEIHRDFHALFSNHSNQLSIVYPSFLNFKSSYSEVFHTS